MALKSDRHEFDTDISFFMNEVATRGGIASISTAGSGAALDQGVALVSYTGEPSGTAPVGILLNDMVNLDLTRQHINQHKDEIQKGGKVTLLRKGWVVTNMIAGTNPTAGQDAYVAHSGYLSASDIAADGTGPSIGTWLSTVDQDGYAKVSINLPVTWKPRADV